MNMEVLDDPRRIKLRSPGISTRVKSALTNRKAKRFARKSMRAIKKTVQGVGQEAVETKDMARLFFRMLESKLELKKRTEPPTPEEVKEAIEQLKDIGRISVFASISIIPGGGFSLIGLEILARKFGIEKFTFVPSAFHKGGRKFKPRSYGKAGTVTPRPELPAEKKASPDRSV